MTKNFFASAAIIVLTSTTALAGSGVATWGGQTGTIHGGGNCNFTKNQPGVMSYANQKWTVTSNAIVILKVKNTNNVKVENDGKLRTQNGAVVADVNVNYTPSSTVSVIGKSGTTQNINTNSITAGNLNKNDGSMTQVTLSIGGSATMKTAADELNLADNTGYKIEHVVTCLQ